MFDTVVTQLRDAILANRIPPGTKLVQTELANQLGVSRSPLREAIRLLEHDGLVQVSNRNGTVEVVGHSDNGLLEMYQIREVIDGLAASLLAVKGMDAANEARLERTIDRMTKAMLPIKGEAMLLAHRDFHTTIVEACGNERLRTQLPLVRITAASLRDVFPRQLKAHDELTEERARGRAAVARAEHAEIFESIRARDPERAERSARAHIRHAIETVRLFKTQ